MGAVTDVRDLARKAAILGVVADLVTTALKSAKAQLRAELAVGERLVPNEGGVALAAVQMVKGHATPAVVDEGKLARWVAEHYPTEVETKTVVRPAFLAALKSASVQAGEPCSPDGVLDVPGLIVTVGDPYVRVTLTGDAKGAVEQMWREGRVSLDGEVRELPGGGH